MLSRAELINQTNASYNAYNTQKSDEKGSKNLFVGGSANDVIINTTDDSVILAGAGDDVIQSTGNGNRIEGNDGNDKIVSTGNGNRIEGNNGNDSILVIGNNNTANGGNGNDAILGLGNYNYLAGGDGNNSIVFEGDNLNITAGNGDNFIASLDFAIANGLYADFASYLDGKSSSYTTKNVLMSSEVVTKEVGKDVKTTQNSTSTSTSTTITTTTTTTTATTVTTQDYTKNKYGDETKTTLGGNKNVNITAGNGNNTFQINSSNLNLTAGNGKNNITAVDGIVVNVGYTNQRTEEVAVDGSKKSTTTTATSTSTNTTNRDPLIIDFNQDGIVSAEHGKGVDIDGNGTADGAATGGDKMLAMTDINGNQKIDGQEVFGDRTIDPFTGKALNAENGFEALRMVAESAQAATGIKCIDKETGLVDLKALNTALQTKGIKLGFVSDENATEVEDLTKVAYINTKDYETKQEDGSVQHNQQGTSIFEDGSTAKADDVWFEVTQLNNPFDFSKLKDLLK